jgi:uncharacterized protein (TIGR02466 family)
MNEMLGIFSTPIMITDIGREFTKEEYDVCLRHQNTVHRNMGNSISAERNVLENELSEIKTILLEKLNQYFEEVYSPDRTCQDIELYITNSWFTYSNHKDFHHLHDHPNSLVSAVLYFNANDEFDKLTFRQDKGHQIEIIHKERNQWNSVYTSVPAKTGKIIIFPSTLMHTVEETAGTDTRISLALNTFVKGTIGTDDRVTRLKVG